MRCGFAETNARASGATSARSDCVDTESALPEIFTYALPDFTRFTSAAKPACSTPRDAVFESLPRDCGIADAGRREIQADAADARLAHRIELGVGDLVVDHRN